MAQSAPVDTTDIYSEYLKEFFAQKPVCELLTSIARPGESLQVPPIRCPHCNGMISEQMIRGAPRRLKPWLIGVQASTFCANCREVSSIQLRLHSRGSADILSNGTWKTKEPQKTPRYQMLFAKKSNDFSSRVKSAYNTTRTLIRFSLRKKDSCNSESST
jgi:hypothetical protein